MDPLSHPLPIVAGMQVLTPSQFIAAARALAAAAVDVGLAPPSFASPPRRCGVERTVRRWPGGARVAVLRTERPAARVLDDMVEGLLLVNDVRGVEAAQARALLSEAATRAVGLGGEDGRPAREAA